MVSWPNATDYLEAVQNLPRSMGDEELREGRAAVTPLGLPMAWSGGFADVYQIHNARRGNTWALKCFTKKVTDQAERYWHISAHLERARLPFMVDFKYLDQGIRIRGEWYPALKMQWVEGGIRLNEFIEQYLNRPRTLKELLRIWGKMATRLRQAAVGHCDLQHGNVLMVPRDGRSLALRLIDYDGIHVPALAGRRSSELGHPAFQHPQRSREGIYSPEVDRFSHLAIYTAIQGLTVGREALWKRFNNDENLLFREEDFRNPGRSEVFRSLWKLPDTDTRALVGRLALACQKPLEHTPLLEKVANEVISPLTSAEEQEVESLLGRESRSLPAAAVEASGRRRRSHLPDWYATAVSSTRGSLPPPLPGQTERSAAEFGRAWLSVLAAIPRWVDRLFGKIAGADNEILHNFLRVLATVGVVMLVIFGGRIAFQWAARTEEPIAFATENESETSGPEQITNSIGMQDGTLSVEPRTDDKGRPVVEQESSDPVVSMEPRLDGNETPVVEEETSDPKEGAPAVGRDAPALAEKLPVAIQGSFAATMSAITELKPPAVAVIGLHVEDPDGSVLPEWVLTQYTMQAFVQERNDVGVARSFDFEDLTTKNEAELFYGVEKVLVQFRFLRKSLTGASELGVVAASHSWAEVPIEPAQRYDLRFTLAPSAMAELKRLAAVGE